MTEIYVIRHVQAEGNLYRHMQGHWDGDVTPVGRQQRDFLALRFKDIPVDAVYSSDLYRARFTASAITKFHALPIQCDRRLREINIGPWEAAPFANVRRDQPELFDAFLYDPAHFYMPGAETYHDVQARVIDALLEIAEKNPNETVPIFHNTGVAHLCYENGRFTVDMIDDASHLPPELLRRVSDIPALRDVCVNPARYRDLYESCYADAWVAAHGNLAGFDAET